MTTQYRVIYRLDRGRPNAFDDVECIVFHRPDIGVVSLLPDGVRYGRVISVERIRSNDSQVTES